MQIKELKAAPQFTGRDSILTYRTSSANTYDMTATPPVDGEQRFRLRLDYSEAIGGALLNLNVFYRLDDPNVMADPMPRAFFTNPHVIVTWEIETMEDTYTTWIVSIQNISTGALTPTAYAKYFIDGTDTGSVTITAI